MVSIHFAEYSATRVSGLEPREFELSWVLA